MKLPKYFLLMAGAALIVTACAGGQVRRVSDPAVSFQQVQVLANGAWAVDLRIQNYSSIPMRFDSINVKMKVDGQDAATIHQAIGMTVGPESPDIFKVTVEPTLVGKAAVADALARKVTLNYRLEGTLTATPEKRGSQTFKINSASSVTPAPGLPGVLR